MLVSLKLQISPAKKKVKMSNEPPHKSRLIMLNQMAGPLFRELAEDLAPLYKDGCLLVTGHPDTLKMNIDKKLK